MPTLHFECFMFSPFPVMFVASCLTGHLSNPCFDLRTILRKCVNFHLFYFFPGSYAAYIGFYLFEIISWNSYLVFSNKLQPLAYAPIFFLKSSSSLFYAKVSELTDPAFATDSHAKVIWLLPLQFADAVNKLFLNSTTQYPELVNRCIRDLQLHLWFFCSLRLLSSRSSTSLMLLNAICST